MSSYPSDRAVFWTATRYLMNCTIIQWASWQVLYFIAFLLFIACKHDRAACGKDGSWFLWERPFFTPLQRRNYGITRYQIYSTKVDVGQRKRIAELGSNWIHGSDSLCGWIIQLQNLGFLFELLSASSSSCSVNSPTDRNSPRIWTFGGSTDVVRRNDLPFECPDCNNYF